MKTVKSLIALLVVFSLLLGLVPVTALAEDIADGVVVGDLTYAEDAESPSDTASDSATTDGSISDDTVTDDTDSGYDFSTAEVIYLNEVKHLESYWASYDGVEEIWGGSGIFAFTPTETDTYYFESFNNVVSFDVYESSYDVCAYAYDSNYELIGNDDDGATNLNFKLCLTLTAGETYYLCADSLSEYDVGEYDVTVRKYRTASDISIDQGDSLSMVVENHVQLTATVLPEPCDDYSVEWYSADAEIAEVDAGSGGLAFKSCGTTTVTATVNGIYSDTIEINVIEPIVISAGEVITGTGISINTNFYRYSFTPTETGNYYLDFGEENFNYIVRTAEGDEYISEIGWRVFELTAGVEYIIQFDFEGKKDYTFSVYQQTVATEITISVDELFGYVNETETVYVDPYPLGSYLSEVSWEIENPEIADINYYNEYCYVTMLSVGTTTLTATSANGATCSINVTVNDATDISLGEVVYLSAESNRGKGLFRFVPEEDGTYAFYSFNNTIDTYGHLYDSSMSELASNDDSSARGNNNFDVTYTLTAGETYYYKARPYAVYSDGDYYVTVEKTVVAENLVITQQNIVAYEQARMNIRAEFLPEGSTQEDIYWSCDNNDIAYIYNQNYGNIDVEFYGVGTAVITASTNSGLSATTEITVLEAPEIEADTTQTGTVTTPGLTDVMKFTAPYSGWYTFFIESDGYMDGMINYYSYTYEGSSAWFQAYFEAGSVNYLKTSFSDETTGNYTVTISSPERPENLQMELYNYSGIDVGEEITLYENAQLEIIAVSYPSGTSATDLVWSASNPDEAITYYENGDTCTVQCLTPGTATLTVSSAEGLSDTVTINVLEAPVLELDVPTTGAINSAYMQGIVKFTPESDGYYLFAVESESGYDNFNHNIYDPDLMWYLELNYEAYNMYSAYLTGGTTYYICTSLDYYETTNYTVTVSKMAEATSVEIYCDGEEVDSVTVMEGEYKWLDVLFFPENAASEYYVLESSEPEIVTVDGGYIYGVQPGTATVTVYAESGLTDTVNITVEEAPAISLGETVYLYTTYDQYSYYYKFTAEESGYYGFDILGDEYSWADITTAYSQSYYYGAGENYRIDAWLEAGQTCYIKFNSNYEGIEYSISATKLVELEGIEIAEGDEMTASVMEDAKFTVNLLPSNGAMEELYIETDNPDIINLYNTWSSDKVNGFKALSAGTATVTVTSSSGYTDSITVTVVEPPQLELGVATGSEISTPNAKNTFLFIPEESGYYKFTAENYLGYMWADACDSYGNYLVRNSNGEQSGNFYKRYFTLYLEAGEKYYFVSQFEDYDITGEYTVYIEKQEIATGYIINYGNDISGYVGGNYWMRGEFTPENSYGEVDWYIEDESIAYISYSSQEHCELELVSPGTTVLTATSTDGSFTVSATVTVKDCDDEIAVEDVKEVTGEQMFKFVPDESGIYRFYSYNNTGTHLDTVAYLYDENLYQLSYSDDDGDNGNFKLEYYLEAGETYYLKAKSYDQSATYFVSLIMPSVATGLTINGSTSGYEGNGLWLHAYPVPEDASIGNISWSVADESIAYVEYYYSNYCQLILLAPGTTTVTVTTESGISQSIEITVKETQNIELETEYTVTFDYSAGIYNNYFQFTPEETGNYLFEFSNILGYISMDLTPTDADVDSVYGYSNNGKINAYLIGGVTYIINIYSYHEELVSGTFTVTDNISVSSVEVLSLPTKTQYYDFEEIYYVTDYTGLKVAVTLSTGDVVTWNYGAEYPDEFMGYRIYVDIINVDTDCAEVEVTCGEASTSFALDILPTPVERLELVSAPTREYIFGDTRYGFIYGNDYEFYPDDLTGLVFNVYFTDGTVRTYSYEDIVGGCKIDGYYIELNNYFYLQEIAENLTVIFTYMGQSLEYNVVIKESSLESIELVTEPDVTEYVSGFLPDFAGMQIKVNYTDGSSEIVTFTKENISMSYDVIYLEFGDYVLVVCRQDEYTYNISCSDSDLDLILYDGISFVEREEIENLTVENPAFTGSETTVTVEYVSGYTETFNLDILFSEIVGGGEVNDYYCDGHLIFANTEHGILQVYIDAYSDKETGEIKKYTYSILDEFYTIDLTGDDNTGGDNTGGDNTGDDVVTFIPGDIDSNGIVTLADVSTIAQYIAGWDLVPGEDYNVAALDINGDGIVTLNDVSVLAQYIAGWNVTISGTAYSPAN